MGPKQLMVDGLAGVPIQLAHTHVVVEHRVDGYLVQSLLHRMEDASVLGKVTKLRTAMGISTLLS